MLETVRRTSRNVKRWQNGDMCLRWTAAGMLEAERQFRRVIGYPKLPALAVAVERERMSRPLLKFGGGADECVRRLGRCRCVRSG